MESPEDTKPKKMEKEKWKRIIQPDGDSDSSLDSYGLGQSGTKASTGLSRAERITMRIDRLTRILGDSGSSSNSNEEQPPGASTSAGVNGTTPASSQLMEIKPSPSTSSQISPNFVFVDHDYHGDFQFRGEPAPSTSSANQNNGPCDLSTGRYHPPLGRKIITFKKSNEHPLNRISKLRSRLDRLNDRVGGPLPRRFRSRSSRHPKSLLSSSHVANSLRTVMHCGNNPDWLKLGEQQQNVPTAPSSGYSSFNPTDYTGLIPPRPLHMSCPRRPISTPISISGTTPIHMNLSSSLNRETPRLQETVRTASSTLEGSMLIPNFFRRLTPNPRTASRSSLESMIRCLKAQRAPESVSETMRVTAPLTSTAPTTVNRSPPNPGPNATMHPAPVEEAGSLTVPVPRCIFGLEALPANVSVQQLLPQEGDGIQGQEDALAVADDRREQAMDQGGNASGGAEVQALKEPLVAENKVAVSDGALNNSILSMLECPVCLEYMGPPIMQCRRGHMVCNSCRVQLDTCPTCRSRFTDLRNLALERITELLSFPCKNEECGQNFKLRNKEEHELNCSWRVFKCLSQQCKWQGHHQEMLVHVQEIHGDLLLKNTTETIEIPLNISFNRNYLMFIWDHLFCVNFRHGADRAGMNALAFYVGPVNQAKNFMFELKLVKPYTDGKSFIIYNHPMFKDNLKIAQNYSAGDCFYIAKDQSKHFADSGGKMYVNVTVKKM